MRVLACLGSLCPALGVYVLGARFCPIGRRFSRPPRKPLPSPPRPSRHAADGGDTCTRSGAGDCPSRDFAARCANVCYTRCGFQWSQCGVSVTPWSMWRRRVSACTHHACARSDDEGPATLLRPPTTRPVTAVARTRTTEWLLCGRILACRMGLCRTTTHTVACSA
ncbi:hypothetical protein BD309DRAFT_701087 [Dichomitus squalens]|nr:hypothetical protein BD309DRAFT_701087 [Dichomitus squalens]